jgi:ribosomal protein L22
MKPPIPERIKALEDMNIQLIEKINRMKAQVRHNQDVIKKLRKREDKQDVQALIDEVQAERLRRSEQSDRDKKRSRMSAAARYREGIDKRIEDCLRMNGKII